MILHNNRNTGGGGGGGCSLWNENEHNLHMLIIIYGSNFIVIDQNNKCSIYYSFNHLGIDGF